MTKNCAQFRCDQVPLFHLLLEVHQCRLSIRWVFQDLRNPLRHCDYSCGFLRPRELRVVVHRTPHQTHSMRTFFLVHARVLSPTSASTSTMSIRRSTCLQKEQLQREHRRDSRSFRRVRSHPACSKQQLPIGSKHCANTDESKVSPLATGNCGEASSLWQICFPI